LDKFGHGSDNGDKEDTIIAPVWGDIYLRVHIMIHYVTFLGTFILELMKFRKYEKIVV
jgi:hypothetical protein